LETGFSEKLLRDLSSELNKIRDEACPLFNLPQLAETVVTKD